MQPRFRSIAIILVAALTLPDIDIPSDCGTGTVDYLPIPVIPRSLRAKAPAFADFHRRPDISNGSTAAAWSAACRNVPDRSRRPCANARGRDLGKSGSTRQGVAHDFNNLVSLASSRPFPRFDAVGGDKECRTPEREAADVTTLRNFYG